MGDQGALVGIVDDHPAILRGVLDGLRELVPDVGRVVTATSVQGLLDDRRSYDLVLLDVHLGDDTDPADNVASLVHRGWPVLLYTQEGSTAVVSRCLRAGASGIVGKHEELPTLAGAIRRVLDGEPHLSSQWAAALEDDPGSDLPELTQRESQALRYYATGLPMKSVARRMNVAHETAKEYLLRVRRKYAEVGRPAATKTDLYIRAVQDGYLPNPADPGQPR